MLDAILVKYGNLDYDDFITPQIEEIGYPFKTLATNNNNQNPILPYSLHTEYSATLLNENTINELEKNNFNILATSLNGGRSSLWHSSEWTEEFIDFIRFIVINKLNNKKPKIIEIHPPYITNGNYQSDLDKFFDNYETFEKKMKKSYGQDLIILIENRNTPINFLLSKSSDYIEFQNKIQSLKLDLKLIVDIPQIYGRMRNINPELNEVKITRMIFNDLLKCTEVIGGFHVCGIGHHGDFNDLFQDNKDNFLKQLKNLTDNIKHTVYVVPEIIGQDNFKSIIADISAYKIFDFG